MLFAAVTIAACCLGFAHQCVANPYVEHQRVALFSVDGFHSSDVRKYIQLRPKSTVAQLLATGYEYTNAFTSAPSDSFPGTLAQFTGAKPKTTGVWYDDTYDRSFFPPGSDCKGDPGAEGKWIGDPDSACSLH